MAIFADKSRTRHGSQPADEETALYSKLYRGTSAEHLLPHLYTSSRDSLGSYLRTSALQQRFDTTTAMRTATHAPSLVEFIDLCGQPMDATSYPLADTVVSSIPIYDGPTILEETELSVVLDEWHRCLLSGPGVFVLRRMYTDGDLIDRCNDIYDQVIKKEKEQNANTFGDFFSAGRNSRVWNIFQKHGMRDPVSFYTYYSNPLLHLVCEAWLGPQYRITAQANVVRPGGIAQTTHRDYHLGFQTNKTASQFPIITQMATQLLTLQGAVAHTDMPVESGPTKVLPFSQQFEQGYAAFRLQEFVDFFEARHVQIPMKKGDAIFFNPALFHAAGSNNTKGFDRSANLLQVSSAFGKPMDAVDTTALVIRCWDVMRENWGAGRQDEVKMFVRAVAEGYGFPTNLDTVPPSDDDTAPESEQDVCLKGMEEGWETCRIVEALRERVGSLRVHAQPKERDRKEYGR